MKKIDNHTYAYHRGRACPYCERENIDVYAYNDEDEEISLCNDCKRLWKAKINHYAESLTNVEVVKIVEKKEKEDKNDTIST